MSGSYLQADVKCPFYIKDTIGQCSSLICEGIKDKTQLRLVFRHIEDKLPYMNTYCNAQYSNCKLYRIINEQYE